MAAFMRMLSCDPESKDDVLAPESDSAVPMVAGTDQHGRGFGVPVTDGQAVGSGARAFKDGVDSGGITIAMMIKLNNVELLEQFYPIVYLYRRKVADSGGAGRWRGGTGVRSAITPLEGVELFVSTFAGGSCVSTHGAPGVAGGYPSATCQFLAMRGTDVIERFTAGHMPMSSADLQIASSETLQPKSVGTHLVSGDVLEVRYSGGGGYGDPITREPERVASDVLAGTITAESADEIYGVVLGSMGTADLEATIIRRGALREQRKRWHGPHHDAERVRPTEHPDQVVHEYVALRKAPSGMALLVCRCCDRVLGSSERSYKAALLVDAAPVTSLPLVGDPARFIDDSMVVRRYACPGCGTLMATEIACASEGLWDEVLLDV